MKEASRKRVSRPPKAKKSLRIREARGEGFSSLSSWCSVNVLRSCSIE